MICITVRRPWSDAIMAGVKRVENRTWRPPDRLVGHVIGLHAGATYEASAFRLIQRLWSAVPGIDDSPKGLLGTVRIRDVVESSDDPFFFGPFGWVLEVDEVFRTPLRIKGKQGFWACDLESLLLPSTATSSP